MNKSELIEIINSLPVGEYEINENFIPPPESFDLPDVRTGAIYPPQAVKIKRYSPPMRREFGLTLSF